MFRFFENLIDPYQPYDERAEIPDRLIPFLRRFLWPARWVIGAGMALGLIAAVTEAALVALLSLYQREPRASPTNSMRCGSDRKVARPRSIASSSIPSTRHTAIAQTAFCALCGPCSAGQRA